jgi:nucleoside-diphosphate-sugar epimerase
MKHLVLGSSGQVGQYLVQYLKSVNEEVLTFDIEDNGLYDLRVRNNLLLTDMIIKSDFVHFLAFDIGGSKYMAKYQNTYEFIDNNMRIMSNTFELLKSLNKPFIFASSQMSNMHHSTYGILKSIGERHTDALNGINVKFWNVYGYETNEEKSHVITDFINMSIKDKSIKMRTTGDEVRQFLFGEDCARALLILAKNYFTLDRAKNYHITSFQWNSIMDIANVISGLSGCEIIKGDKVDNVQMGMVNDPDPYILNYWEPKISLDKGISILYNDSL